MPILTDNIVAGPAGHFTAHDAGHVSAGGSGHVPTGAPGHVGILPATQNVHSASATLAFEALDATKESFNADATKPSYPESLSGTVVHIVA